MDDSAETLITDFIRDAGELAHRAIAQDKEENYEIAVYFYGESISLLDRARVEIVSLFGSELEDSTSSNENNGNDDSESSGRGGRRVDFWKDKLSMTDRKMREYQRRIEELERCESKIVYKAYHTGIVLNYQFSSSNYRKPAERYAHD